MVPLGRSRSRATPESLPGGRVPGLEGEPARLVQAPRREEWDTERGASPPQQRRVRRRRGREPWLQRNALGVAAISVLLAVASVGFGVTQLLVRGEQAPPQAAPVATASTSSQQTRTGGTADTAPAAGQLSGAAFAPLATSVPSSARAREVRVEVRALEPNYMVEPGDTLGQIAVRHKTTVERIQALNNLPDPRRLSIGQKLVIPPPLP